MHHFDDVGPSFSVEETMARAYAATNQDVALRLCDAILEEDPHYVPALYHRAVLYSAKQDWERAIRAYDVAIAESPHDPSLRYNAGVLCLQAGFSNAERYLVAARDLDPECEGAHYHLAKLHFERRDFPTALDLARAALRLRPTDCTIGVQEFVGLIEEIEAAQVQEHTD